MAIQDILEGIEYGGIHLIAINESGRNCIRPFSAYMNSIGITDFNKYEIFPKIGSRKPDKYLCMAKKEKLISDNMTLDEFSNDPKLRFVGSVNTDNLALLLDDYLFKGETARPCIKDLVQLGYKKENILIATWGYDPYVYDSDLNILRGISQNTIKKFSGV